jgi:hypothetical protein
MTRYAVLVIAVCLPVAADDPKAESARLQGTWVLVSAEENGQEMSSREVEALVGRPLDRIRQEDGTVLWTYSNRDDCTCDFEMRWVDLDEGRVKYIVNIYLYE